MFAVIVFFSIGSCERKGLPDFTEALEGWGISMRHPKFEKLERRGFIPFHTYPPSTPKYFDGSLEGYAEDYTIQIGWHSGGVRFDESEDEYNRIKQILSLRVDAQGKRWIDSTSPKDSITVIKKWELKQTTGDFKWEERKDFMKDSCDYFISPMEHRIFYQTWSYVDTTDEAVYGVSAVWGCRESRRLFFMTISNKYNYSEAFLKKFLEHFKCHGIKP